MADKTHLGTAFRLLLGLALLVAGAVGIDWLLRVQNYPVRSVRFEGPFERVARAELEAKVMPLVHGNFFLVDLDAIKHRVESIAWVYRASVRRRFPADIDVQFSEQRLFARWGDGAWLNTSGEVVRVHGDELPTDVPVFTGPDGTGARALSAYNDFTQVLAPAGLRIAALHVTPRHGWRLELERDAAAPGDARFALILDNDEPHKRLERFARVYRANMANDAGMLKQVDLRYTNGLSVEWRGARARAIAGAASAAAADKG